MKKVASFLTFIFTVSAFCQHVEKVEKFQITFQSPEKLTPYETESDSVVGFHNDNYAVDFEVVPLAYESDNFKNDIKKAAFEIGYDMGFTPLVDGGKAASITKSFFVIGSEADDEKKYPVIIMAIVNDKLDVAYEITIYCYNGNEEGGKKIAESFALLD